MVMVFKTDFSVFYDPAETVSALSMTPLKLLQRGN
jgi:hypothetical protein